MEADFERAIEAHDAAVAQAGKRIWVGAEPTFTVRHSESPEWLYEPLGGDKQRYALRMVADLWHRHPGSLVMRSVGRQYPAEQRPRWSIGVYERRDGVAVWDGPPDPLAGPPAPCEPERLDRFLERLQQKFRLQGWTCVRVQASDALGRRLLVRLDGEPLDALDRDDPRLARPSIHVHRTPTEGLSDPLAAEGVLLFAVGELELAPGLSGACLELPAFTEVTHFLEVLSVVGDAANSAGLVRLVLQGFPPPVSAGTAWTTVTPDPAVIEVNQAPQPDIGRFLAGATELYEVAEALGLSPYRLHYNGTASDSGGGGQFTLGGPSPEDSPFLVDPLLLPRLVRYFNHHPALSYLFAPEYVGPASQSPRPDEGTRDAFRELAVALDQLERHRPERSPELLWAGLAPFLADPSGNTHRSELNIEKLWNPHLPARGCLGLVEFRAFRMPYSPQRAAAIAALLRGIAAMAAVSDPAPGLKDWGDALHDRMALPFFLRQDLGTVFADLEARGFGLQGSLQAVLLDDPCESRWSTMFEGCELTIERGVEFWPLVGDVASQESGGSRLVDSSTVRLQLSLRHCGADGPALDGWQLRVAGFEVPLATEGDGAGELRLTGLRYRDFAPWRGLHPTVKPHGPLTLTLVHPQVDKALLVTLFNWHPEGRAYEGLPADLHQAAARRAERLVTRGVPRTQLPPATIPPSRVLSGYTFDLRLCEPDCP